MSTWAEQGELELTRLHVEWDFRAWGREFPHTKVFKVWCTCTGTLEPKNGRGNFFRLQSKLRPISVPRARANFLTPTCLQIMPLGQIQSLGIEVITSRRSLPRESSTLWEKKTNRIFSAVSSHNASRSFRFFFFVTANLFSSFFASIEFCVRLEPFQKPNDVKSKQKLLSEKTSLWSNSGEKPLLHFPSWKQEYPIKRYES